MTSDIEVKKVVVAIQEIPVLAGTPGDGYVLTYVAGNTDWEAKEPAVQFIAGGDLSGTSTNQTVIKIDGASVPAAGASDTV